METEFRAGKKGLEETSAEDVQAAWRLIRSFRDAGLEDRSQRGLRVEKCRSDPGDITPDGSTGTIELAMSFDGGDVAFVIWDHLPKIPVAIAAYRIRAIQTPGQ